jgi:hypothetical protein
LQQETAIMGWRTRVAAILLASGSVAGCAGAGDPGDAGTYAPPPLASVDSQAAPLLVAPAPTTPAIVRRTSSSETAGR